MSSVGGKLSVVSLLLSNLITIVYAWVFEWKLPDLMLVYWFQSVIIGIFQFRKILELKNFSTEGFRINNNPVSPTEETKRFTANFFLLHYGIFHMVYFMFIFISRPDFIGAIPLVVVFFVNHLISYLSNHQADSLRHQNIGTIMFQPYARILPMHLTLIFGSGLNFASQSIGVFNSVSRSSLISSGAFAGSEKQAVILFQFLKTIADVIMHLFEHRAASKTHVSTVINSSSG